MLVSFVCKDEENQIAAGQKLKQEKKTCFTLKRF